MISVTILTKNSEKYLEEVLNSVKTFDEVILYDNGSEDQTEAIGKKFPNVKIVKGLFIGFGPTHNAASEAAKNDWILSIDSDEVVTEELIEEVQSLSLNPNIVYSFSRRNYYNGKWIRWCGWHPDFVRRLYNKSQTQFTNDHVHECVSISGVKEKKLTSSIKHYSYSSAEDFLTKMQTYSTLFAKQNKGKKSSSPFKAFTHSLFTFFKCYILKRGFLGGFEGYMISRYNANTAYYKYIKLYEANKER